MLLSVTTQPGAPMTIHTWHKNHFTLTTDKTLLDLDYIQRMLDTTYWAKGISLDTVRTAVDHSLCFGMFEQQKPIGFARLVTDHATFGYLCDVFIDPAFRRQGLGRWLMDCIFSLPEQATFRRLLLVTRDAHPLYQTAGFTALAKPDTYMEKLNPSPTTACTATSQGSATN